MITQHNSRICILDSKKKDTKLTKGSKISAQKIKFHKKKEEKNVYIWLRNFDKQLVSIEIVVHHIIVIDQKKR